MSADITERRVDLGPRRLRLLEAGPGEGKAILLLHGWPECADSWSDVIRLGAADGYRMLAPDLPGIGGSSGDPTDGTTKALAEVVEDLLEAEGVDDAVLVGHDFGGMIAYPCLRRSQRLDRAVIMDVVVPGLPPWEQVLASPYLWHFAFHSIPDLPETLVEGRTRAYFDFFFDALAPRSGSGVSEPSRERCVAAYASRDQLSAGFSWYRGFRDDAEDNASIDGSTDRPLLYLRGHDEGGELSDYERGFRSAGVLDVSTDVIPDAGHFAAEDAPAATWARLRAFADPAASTR